MTQSTGTHPTLLVCEGSGQCLDELSAEDVADAVRSLAEDLNRRNSNRRPAA